MKVYLERPYRHRYPAALIAGMVLMAIGGSALWGLLARLGKDELPEPGVGSLLVALAVLGGAGLFVFAGANLAHGWLTNRIDLLTITDAGIGHFGKFTKWEEIKWLSYGSKRKGELMIFYQKNGLGFDRYLPVTDPLPEEVILTLFQQLEVDLRPRYKDLRIG